MDSGLPTIDVLKQKVEAIFGHCSEIDLVTVFGSYSRNQANSKSDIDLLVWLRPGSSWTRRDVWKLWDSQMKELGWTNRVSIVVRRLAVSIQIETIIFDFPEEHRALIDRNTWHSKISGAVIKWRKKNQSEQIEGFGGRKTWRYSKNFTKLSDMDFTLGLEDVA